jgi:integrase
VSLGTLSVHLYGRRCGSDHQNTLEHLEGDHPQARLNLEKRTVYLSETKNGSPRTVPLTKKAENIFRMALSNPVRPFDTDQIFFGEPGREEIRRRYELRPAWHRTLKDAGIKGLLFHDLRDEVVSRLVEAGLGDQ